MDDASSATPLIFSRCDSACLPVRCLLLLHLRGLTTPGCAAGTGVGGQEEDEGLDLMPYFASSAFSGFGDDVSGFYHVYSEAFATLWADEQSYADEPEEDCPNFGGSPSYGARKTAGSANRPAVRPFVFGDQVEQRCRCR